MSGWLSLAITVILVVVVTIVLNRTITVRTSRQTALDDIKREVGAIITELNATTERNIQLIEDRTKALEVLIAQADRRLGALRRDISSHDAQSATYTHLGRPAASDRADAAAGVSGHPLPTSGANDSGAAPGRGVEDGRALGDSGAQRGPLRSAGSPSGADDSRSALRARVRGLYLQGVSLERIASIVGKTVGEVELIVSLDEGSER